MRAYVLICLASLLFSACRDNRLVRKVVESGDDVFMWYHYSRIGNFSSERITLMREGEDEVMICESDGVVTDFEIISDTLRLKVYAPTLGGLYFVHSSPVLGYSIVVDSSATLDDFRSRPDGVKSDLY